tara:strand:+ start:465 stop:1520 length:1056 start_codon:yes stop_codon:yes gene_type:complete
MYQEYLNLVFGNNTLQAYSYALIAFFVSYIVLKIFRFGILNRLEKLAKKTTTDLDDILVSAIKGIHGFFYLLLSLFIATKYLTVPDLVTNIILYAMNVLIVYYLAGGISLFIGKTTNSMIKKKEKADELDDIPSIELIGKASKAILWVFASILILSNLGYDVSTLIAGLGISGIAIAFALQNILSDIFASFSIHFDKPFQRGDYIVIGTDSGTVEKIGIKSTRIKTLQGQELVVSNKELTNTRVNNYKKMEKRRIVFNLGVTYDTSSANLEKIPKIITDIIEKLELAEPDRVHFNNFGDFSLGFEVVYYMLDSDYTAYMDTQEKINLEIKKAFEKEKIEMAFPTQTIHLAK